MLKKIIKIKTYENKENKYSSISLGGRIIFDSCFVFIG